MGKGILNYFAALVQLAAQHWRPALPDLKRVDRHHPGAIGHGHLHCRNTSQRERANRRKAKRRAR